MGDQRAFKGRKVGRWDMEVMNFKKKGANFREELGYA